MEKQWVAEFVLRQPIRPALLNRILVSLSPLQNPNPNLKKTLLLRRVLSHLPASISTETLTSLELLQTLNPTPNPNPNLLRMAYLHSAVASTLAPLRRGDLPAFLRAVDATWRKRVGDLERSPAAAEALASEGLWEWRRRMEAAAGDPKARNEVLAAWDWKGGMDAVVEYVRAEFAAMGPAFLDMAARRERNGKRKRKASNARRVSNCIPTPEVHKVREALIRSSKALQNVVEDPLPHAKEVADSLIAQKLVAGMHVDEQNQQKENSNLSEENQNNVDKIAPVHSADKAGEAIGTESINDPAKPTKVSIMDRNPTARTYEWEDDESLDSSEDGSLPSKKPHLPTPRTKPSSPLKVLKVNKVVTSARGRKRRKWSVLEEDTLREAVNNVLEEDTLREAVNKYGKGNWKQILNCYRDIFEERTEVDLKDKWRNMTR